MIRHINKYRRAVQFSILALLIAIPVFNLLKMDAVQGTLCAIGTASYEIVCGLGALQSMLAKREIHWPLLLSASFFIILAILFGRVFCSWICPQGLISEGADAGRTKWLKRPRFPDLMQRYRNGRTLLLSILGGGLLATFIVGIPVICYICPIGIICRQLLQGSMLYKIGGETVIIVLIIAAEVFISRRGWCRYLCPLGAFYSLFSNRFSLTVKRDPLACVQCGTCAKVCSMGNAPIKDEINKTCTNCAECIDQCPEGALSFSGGKTVTIKPDKS